MKAFRRLGFFIPVTLLACATGVRQDLVDSDDEGFAGSGGSLPNGGTPSNGGSSAKAGSSSMSGTGPKAFGGTATSGGSGGSAGEATGGGSSAGSGGKGGSGGSGGGSAGGGRGGSGGSGGGSGGSGGSPVGPGDCSDTAVWSMGAGSKYAAGATVVATCNGGTPCTQAQPPLEDGAAYEFECTDQFNCGLVDPGSTNWSDPPWAATKACE